MTDFTPQRNGCNGFPQKEDCRHPPRRGLGQPHKTLLPCSSAEIGPHSAPRTHGDGLGSRFEPWPPLTHPRSRRTVRTVSLLARSGTKRPAWSRLGRSAFGGVVHCSRCANQSPGRGRAGASGRGGGHAPAMRILVNPSPPATSRPFERYGPLEGLPNYPSMSPGSSVDRASILRSSYWNIFCLRCPVFRKKSIKVE